MKYGTDSRSKNTENCRKLFKNLTALVYVYRVVNILCVVKFKTCIINMTYKYYSKTWFMFLNLRSSPMLFHFWLYCTKPHINNLNFLLFSLFFFYDLKVWSLHYFWHKSVTTVWDKVFSDHDVLIVQCVNGHKHKSL